MILGVEVFFQMCHLSLSFYYYVNLFCKFSFSSVQWLSNRFQDNLWAFSPVQTDSLHHPSTSQIFLRICKSLIFKFKYNLEPFKWSKSEYAFPLKTDILTTKHYPWTWPLFCEAKFCFMKCLFTCFNNFSVKRMLSCLLKGTVD